MKRHRDNEVKQLAEVSQSARRVCRRKLGPRSDSASKSRYYQTNGLTRGGHVAFIWELNDSLE